MKAAALLAVALACGDAAVRADVLRPAGPQAAAAAQQAWLLLGGGALVFVAVMVLLALTLRHGSPRRPVGMRLWLGVGGVVVPSVVLSGLFLHAQGRGEAAAQGQALEISVGARMWWWEVRYRAPGGGEVVLANEIHLPAGRPVRLGLTSADVIHSLWIPALGGKLDMVPGRVQHLRLTADAIGVHRGRCAEFCGVQHARMALVVVVHAPQAFERWLAAQAEPAAAPAGALAQRGREVFAQRRCNACHQVRGLGLPAGPGQAPDLTHVASRLTLGAGTLPAGEGELRRWVRQVQQLKSGARMPASDDLDDEALHALGAFLAGLR